MRKLSMEEYEAYRIGANEAYKSKRIVPACNCKEMMNLIKGLDGCKSTNLIKSYMAGMMQEIGKQALSELIAGE